MLNVNLELGSAVLPYLVLGNTTNPISPFVILLLVSNLCSSLNFKEEEWWCGRFEFAVKFPRRWRERERVEGGAVSEKQQPAAAVYSYWARGTTCRFVPLPVPKKLSPSDLSNHRGSANIRSALNTRHQSWSLEIHFLVHLPKHGYREGISAGQIDSAQEGFNGGFKDSVLVGYNWGLVRGVTSALSYLPEEVRKKMVETEANIMELKSLHESARSISTEAALKLFYEDTSRKKASSETGNFDSDIQQLGNQISDSNALVDHFRKLRLLLKEDTKMMIFNSQ